MYMREGTERIRSATDWLQNPIINGDMREQHSRHLISFGDQSGSDSCISRGMLHLKVDVDFCSGGWSFGSRRRLRASEWPEGFDVTIHPFSLPPSGPFPGTRVLRLN